MSTQFVFSISYISFVILIAISCLYDGIISRRLKQASALCGTIAVCAYIIFIKNIL